MYVPDEDMTAAYRGAIAAMGFDASHAALIQVDVAEEGTSDGRPRYRITSGIQVVRDGRSIRRTIMLWHVDRRDDVLTEAWDRKAVATMLAQTVPLLPAHLQLPMPVHTTGIVALHGPRRPDARRAA